MPSPIMTAYIDIRVNTNNLNQQFQQVRNSATTNANIISKQFVTNFTKVNRAVGQMGRAVQSALKAMTVPMALVGWKAINALMKSSSIAGEEARTKWNSFNKDFTKNMVRIGDFIINTKIAGKSLDEWGRSLNRWLSGLTRGDIERLTKAFVNMSEAIIAIGAALKTMSGLTGLVKFLALFGGGAAVGGGVATVAHQRGLIADAAEKRSQFTSLKKLQPTNPYLGWAEQRAVASETAALAGGTALAATSKSMLLFLKGLGTWSLIVTGVLAGVGTIFNALNGKIDQGKTSLENAVKGLTTAIGGIYSAISIVFKEVYASIIAWINTTVGLLFTYQKDFNYRMELLKRLWMQPFEEAAGVQPIMSKEQARQQAIETGPTNRYENRYSKTFEEIDREFVDALNKISDKYDMAVKLIHEEFDKTADAIIEGVEYLGQTIRISKRFAEDSNKLTENISELQNERSDKLQKVYSDLEKERLSYSGQFVGGTELIKFQQQFQTDWANALVESNRTIAEIEAESDKDIKKSNDLLEQMNQKFDIFIKYVNAGLEPEAVAEGVGL